MHGNMAKTKNWFDVSKDGLKKLQLGKPMHYAIRELLQNAMDEDTTRIDVDSTYENGRAEFVVIDDSSMGFRDLSDAYTLFQPTYKQENPEKRGRFNLGEKQAFSICEEATIITTTGSIIFDKRGRHTNTRRTQKGTEVHIIIKIKKTGYESILSEISKYIMPKQIDYRINGAKINRIESKSSYPAKLLTEFEKNGIMRQAERETIIDIIEPLDKSILYEMGIPVIEIDCDYSINVQQRIPLGVDRETVKPIFMKELFAEVLKRTKEELPEESSGASWVRMGMTMIDRMDKETVDLIIKKRYGEKALVSNPSDPISIDDAISNDYNVVRGNEMNREEWETVRRFGSLQSTSDVFKHATTDTPTITELTPDMMTFKDLTIQLGKEYMGIDVSVSFFRDGQMVAGQYDREMKHVSFNLAKVDVRRPFAVESVALIFHELAHEKGQHTEEGYHEALSLMCAKLWVKGKPLEELEEVRI